MSNRKSIPRDVRRQICIEAGYRCAVSTCGHENGLDIHHIDGDSDNNSPENLLLLCAVHHRMATRGEIDQKACRKIKGHLSTEHILSYLSKTSITPLPTRKKYNDAVIEALESSPKLLRAIIIGPHFLHPQWIIQRRLEREHRKSFSLTLRDYLEESLHPLNRDIRLIIRNSIRYPQEILKPLVKQHEIPDLIQEMKSALHTMFSNPESSHMSFCCTDPGLYQVLITEKSCFVTVRRTDQSLIEDGYELKDPQVIEMELIRFDRIFDADFKGQGTEIDLLGHYIASLEHLIYEYQTKGGKGLEGDLN
jgi:hypothetical protein